MSDVIRIPEAQAVNARLAEVELALGRTHLRAMPRNLGVVIGNGCNIDCPHCYQVKNGDNLFRDAEIGASLRREILSLVPYLSTLRIQGGEVFALRGFEELVAEVASVSERPLISISTNGTLIAQDWAERIVSMPFQHVTVSIDGGTPETYARLRRGGDFDTVVANIRRISELKRSRRSAFPTLDIFFVVMRSNFREIPALLDLARSLDIQRISFQTMLLDDRNLTREPWLGQEVIRTPNDVADLRAVLETAAARGREHDMDLVWSGFRDLFATHGLDADFLGEEDSTLTPDRPGRAAPAGDIPAPRIVTPDVPPMPAGAGNDATCSNPWYTMFVTENGDVSICFLSEPIGNLYRTPLVEIWNAPQAIAKRSRMLAGRVTESGCSQLWCKWRDGQVTDTPDPDAWRDLLALFASLVRRLELAEKPGPDVEIAPKLRNIRRLVDTQAARIAELEANLSLLWTDNGMLHEGGRRHIDALEDQVRGLRLRIAELELPEDVPG
ncbi:Cyclic pyranopterin monophosphate synthase 1 [Marinibacterium anthonyi]|nr:Cyclic pyranopterin monophosphate synthase 1 [Marinibacterium anthonyi]